MNNVKKGKRGDIALDEIVLTLNRRCSPISDFGDLVTHYCDFETDTCQYEIEPKDDNESTWTRVQPQSAIPGFNEPPFTDHTLLTSDGYYMKLRVYK